MTRRGLLGVIAGLVLVRGLVAERNEQSVMGPSVKVRGDLAAKFDEYERARVRVERANFAQVRP